MRWRSGPCIDAAKGGGAEPADSSLQRPVRIRKQAEDFRIGEHRCQVWYCLRPQAREAGAVDVRKTVRQTVKRDQLMPGVAGDQMNSSPVRLQPCKQRQRQQKVAEPAGSNDYGTAQNVVAIVENLVKFLDLTTCMTPFLFLYCMFSRYNSGVVRTSGAASPPTD